MAAAAGLEPASPGSEPGVLPLDDAAAPRPGRTRTGRVPLRRRAPTPAGGPLRPGRPVGSRTRAGRLRRPAAALRRRAGRWWRRRESNPHFLGANQAASHWHDVPETRWTTPPESNRPRDALRASASPPSPTWPDSWCPVQDSNLPPRVRSAGSSSRGRGLSRLVRLAGLEPASPAWRAGVLAAGRQQRTAGAGGGSRTRVTRVEASGPAPGRRQHTDETFGDRGRSRTGRTRLWRPHQRHRLAAAREPGVPERIRTAVNRFTACPLRPLEYGHRMEPPVGLEPTAAGYRPATLPCARRPGRGASGGTRTRGLTDTNRARHRCATEATWS